MNARELHDITKGLIDKQVDRLCYGTDERQIVLRALDLLASKEEAESRQGTHWEGCWEHHFDCAKAAIVAPRAERDALKAHAEAMADALEEAKRLGWHHRALDAYRRDFPKDAP